ncbi:MAG: Tetratricopeptide repeat-containing protein [Glomeribacter sp. 1016415]|nr:Tetratricopeptide repeat-containing protein [Glomeribacter sp. 1016415]
MKTSAWGHRARIWAALLCISSCLSSAYGQPTAAAEDSTRISPAAESASSALAAQLQKLEQRIKSHPKDVQARFKHATTLIQLGREREAMAAFQALIKRYPELPEPYNNLAYLHSRHGAYEAARGALETALNANPNYALTQQNLGALYLQFAAQAYQRALALDRRDTLSAQRQQQIYSILSRPEQLRNTPGNPLKIAPAPTSLK